MTNRITFTINTEEFYSEDEKDDFLGAFVAWVQGMDGGVDTDSADIDVTDTLVKEGVTEDAKLREAAAGLIANGIIEVNVRVLDIDDNVIAKNQFSTED